MKSRHEISQLLSTFWKVNMFLSLSFWNVEAKEKVLKQNKKREKKKTLNNWKIFNDSRTMDKYHYYIDCGIETNASYRRKCIRSYRGVDFVRGYHMDTCFFFLLFSFFIIFFCRFFAISSLNAIESISCFSCFLLFFLCFWMFINYFCNCKRSKTDLVLSTFAFCRALECHHFRIATILRIRLHKIKRHLALDIHHIHNRIHPIHLPVIQHNNIQRCHRLVLYHHMVRRIQFNRMHLFHNNHQCHRCHQCRACHRRMYRVIQLRRLIRTLFLHKAIRDFKMRHRFQPDIQAWSMCFLICKVILKIRVNQRSVSSNLHFFYIFKWAKMIQNGRDIITRSLMLSIAWDDENTSEAKMNKAKNVNCVVAFYQT